MKIPFDKQQVIITCCSHGLRSVKAVSILKARGYRNVYNGGAWSDLEKKAQKKITVIKFLPCPGK